MFHPTDFILHISLGNAAMSSTLNVAAALEEVAGKVRSSGGWPVEGGMRDVNGNTVGNFKTEGEYGPMDDDDLIEAGHKLTAVMPGDVEEALEMFWGNGMADDEHGSVDEPGGQTFRYDRWTLHTNEAGFKTVTKHDTVNDAKEVMADLHIEQMVDEISD